MFDEDGFLNQILYYLEHVCYMCCACRKYPVPPSLVFSLGGV